MCALRAHINFHFWKKNFSRIEKVMTIFSTLDKIFLKIKSLMCALRAHINRILLYITFYIYIYIYIYIPFNIYIYNKKKISNKACR